MARAKSKAAPNKPRARRPSVKPPPKRMDATSATIDALFAELERDPDDEGATLVLADALAELGDVRAELVQIQHAIAGASVSERASYKPREAALIHAMRARLLGSRFAAQPEISLGVRRGFARELAIVNHAASDVAEILSAALPSPEARLLESLHLAWDAEEVMGVGGVFRSLAGKISVPASLRRLSIGNAFERDTDDRIATTDYDDDDEELAPQPEDLRAVLTMFPRLRELALDLGVVPVQLAPLATKNLEVLRWVTPRLSLEEVAPLAGCVLPSLRHFELWIGGVYGSEDGEMHDGEPGDDLDIVESLPLRRLEPVLVMLDRCTQLRELGFGHVQRVGTLLAMLRGHPLVGRLETLELSRVEIDDPGELIDFMRETPTLKKLVLNGASAGESTRGSLERRLGSRFVADWSREPLRFRYVTGYE